MAFLKYGIFIEYDIIGKKKDHKRFIKARFARAIKPIHINVSNSVLEYL